MPRIVGVNIPEGEKVDLALTRIYGIGQNNVERVLQQAEVEKDKRAQQLNEEEIARLNKVLGDMKIEGELRQEVQANIARLKRIESYRGKRHEAGLPVRGQQTQVNARTKRGRRQTVGALKKEAYADQPGREEEEEE